MLPVRHVLDLESMLFGVSRQNPRSLAFQLAVKNDITHGFNNEKLMINTGTTTISTVRACGFNVKSVSDFFGLLVGEIDKNKLDGTRIYNRDEEIRSDLSPET